MGKMKRIVAGGLSLAMALSIMSVGVYAEDEETQTYEATSGVWGYTYEGTSDGTPTSNATIIYAYDEVAGYEVTLVPGELGGVTVDTFGGTDAVLTNNKVDDNYVLFADSITTISTKAFYDYNVTAAWSLPAVTSVESTSFQSCSGLYYGLADSEVESMAGDDFVEIVSGTNTVVFSVQAGENGSIVQEGNYQVPTTMLSLGYSAEINISADDDYKIASITVDGTDLDLDELTDDNGSSVLQDVTIEYVFNTSDTYSVTATFTPLSEDESESTDSEDVSEEDYVAPEIVEGAVAEGAVLPDDVYDYAADTDGESPRKYSSTMNLETGTYYAIDGVLYEMIYITQNVCYRSKAEVINAVYESDGLVYGEDYDLIRLFNYVHSYTSGPRPGDFEIYCVYLYKSYDSDTISDVSSNAEYERAYEHVNDEGENAVIQGDVATVMVQAGETVTINNLVSHNNTIAYGPSEAANFYGLGSAVLVDGGDEDASNTYLGQIRDYTEDGETATLVLNDPEITGTENVVYAVAGGVAHLNGGRYFGTSSGGHGLYVGMGGQITLNADDENGILDEDGYVQTDYEYLVENVLDERPELDLGYAVSCELTEDWNAYASPVFKEEDSNGDAIDDDVAIIVTADETGTALTTDTGGGTIVANRLSATTYGRGCAGVYSIGADESLVYVYNSALHSNADSGLCSASAGYIFAFNCEIKGVAGIKTRSSGSGTIQGVTIYNSKVICAFEPENYTFYHMATDEDSWEDWEYLFGTWSWADDTSLVNCPMLNLFINKTSYSWGQDISAEQSYWYDDKNTAPQTGEAMACILLTGSAPVDSYSVYYVNENYENYKDEGALNYLIAADNGGSGVVNFYDQNSETVWDLTGVCDETTELVGDIYISAIITMTGPDAGDGPSSLTATFNNSEWEGVVLGYLCNADLTFDADSTWTVTGDTGVGNLTIASEDCVVADTAVTINVYDTLTIAGQIITEDTTIGNVTYNVGAESVYFSDLEDYSWCVEYADDLAAEGYIESGTLNPTEVMTRAEFVEVLYQAAGAPDVDSLESFDDVSEDYEYAAAIAWAQDEGITVGTSTTSLLFVPEGTLTREQAMTFLYRAFDALELTAGDSSDLSEFVDGSSVSDWAYEAVSLLVGMGIVEGRGNGYLDPQDEVTTSEMVCMVSRALDAGASSSSGGMGDMGMGDMDMDMDMDMDAM